MTQNEIRELLEPIEKSYDEVRAKLFSLRKEDYITKKGLALIPDPERFERHKENLMGQIHAYQHVITNLVSCQLNIAVMECNAEIEKNEQKTKSILEKSHAC
jgi:hypothetical protein